MRAEGKPGRSDEAGQNDHHGEHDGEAHLHRAAERGDAQPVLYPFRLFHHQDNHGDKASHARCMHAYFCKNIDKKVEANIESLVKQMVEAKRHQTELKTEREKNFIDNKCQSLDHQIDRLVYQLYDLTEEEIKIVESN